MDWQILLGIACGTLGTLVVQGVTRRWERQDREAEWGRKFKTETLIEPIVSFMDETLSLMDSVYCDLMDGKPPKYEKLVELRDKEEITRARVAAFGDQGLSEGFEQLSRRYLDFREHIHENKPADAFNVKREATGVATKMLKRIEERLTLK